MFPAPAAWVACLLVTPFPIAGRLMSTLPTREPFDSRNLASRRTFVMHIHLRRKQNGSRPFALADWNPPSNHPSHLAFRRTALADQPTSKNAGGAHYGASCSFMAS